MNDQSKGVKHFSNSACPSSFRPLPSMLHPTLSFSHNPERTVSRTWVCFPHLFPNLLFQLLLLHSFPPSLHVSWTCRSELSSLRFPSRDTTRIPSDHVASPWLAICEFLVFVLSEIFFFFLYTRQRRPTAPEIFPPRDPPLSGFPFRPSLPISLSLSFLMKNHFRWSKTFPATFGLPAV